MYPHERSLVKKLAGKPFVLIGVNSDKDLDKLKPSLEKNNISWRSFWNGPKGTRGPISAAWDVMGWPTIYILDENGVIRDRNKRNEAMEVAVMAVLDDTKSGEK
jgi:hypothetical protein